MNNILHAAGGVFKNARPVEILFRNRMMKLQESSLERGKIQTKTDSEL